MVKSFVAETEVQKAIVKGDHNALLAVLRIALLAALGLRLLSPLFPRMPLPFLPGASAALAGLLALAAVENLLDEPRHLGLADRLQVVASEGRAHRHRAHQARVRERDRAPVVDGEDTVIHRREDCVGAAAISRDLAEA